MKNLTKKLKLFWPWQDTDEEKWLEDQSQKGLHLVKPSIFGRYTFEESAPKEYIYKLDFQSDTSKDKDSYLQIFKDSGWEYLGEASWQYFRKELQEDEPIDIFTDNDSKIKKYGRLQRYYTVFFVILLVLFTTVILPSSSETLQWLDLLLVLLYIPLLIIHIISMIKITNRIKLLNTQVQD